MRENEETNVQEARLRALIIEIVTRMCEGGAADAAVVVVVVVVVVIANESTYE